MPTSVRARSTNQQQAGGFHHHGFSREMWIVAGTARDLGIGTERIPIPREFRDNAGEFAFDGVDAIRGLRRPLPIAGEATAATMEGTPVSHVGCEARKKHSRSISQITTTGRVSTDDVSFRSASTDQIAHSGSMTSQACTRAWRRPVANSSRTETATGSPRACSAAFT